MNAGDQFAEVRLLGVAGSLRAGSYSHYVLEHALGLVRRVGFQAESFDLRNHPLPLCNGDKADPRADFPAVAMLRHKVSRAHGLILVTPEYHGGMSGVMKNMIDLLDFEHLEGKVVGCISVLGGPSNSNALNDLRHVLRWCHSWVIPQQIAIGRVREVLASGQVRDPELLERFAHFIASLLSSTLRLSPAFSPQFSFSSTERVHFRKEMLTGIAE